MKFVTDSLIAGAAVSYRQCGSWLVSAKMGMGPPQGRISCKRWGREWSWETLPSKLGMMILTVGLWCFSEHLSGWNAWFILWRLMRWKNNQILWTIWTTKKLELVDYASALPHIDSCRLDVYGALAMFLPFRLVDVFLFSTQVVVFEQLLSSNKTSIGPLVEIDFEASWNIPNIAIQG